MFRAVPTIDSIKIPDDQWGPPPVEPGPRAYFRRLRAGWDEHAHQQLRTHNRGAFRALGELEQLIVAQAIAERFGFSVAQIENLPADELRKLQQQAATSPALQARDLDLLKAHAAHPGRALSVYDLETILRLSRRSFGPRIARLVGLGLLHRPGARKGSVITQAGLAALNTPAARP